MKTEQKIIRAIEKTGLNFSYNLRCNNSGKIIGIVNLDAGDRQFGPATNKYAMELKLDAPSKMTLTEIVEEIQKKWGKVNH